MPSLPDHSLADHWLAAVARDRVSAALDSVYAAAAAEIAARAPACWASGRCCNFERTGHRLYVTGLEAAYTVSRLPDIAGTRPENAAAPRLTRLSLASARQRGGCPFQAANLCSVHPIKPLGCRLYFCDRTAQDWQQELSERLISDVRAIHDEHQIEYRYAEWRDLLERFTVPAA